MPCLNGDEHERDCRPVEREKFPKDMIEAILCGVLRATDKKRPDGVIPEILHRVDWEEAGVDQEEAEKWFRQHERKDKARRARESNHKSALRKDQDLYDSLITKPFNELTSHQVRFLSKGRPS